jgi:phosphopantothenoylcysteine decarboxylase/phosphopantothenate--cysteine ligase
MSSFAHDLFVATKSECLQGLKITLCGGGGIAAIELPKVAREMRRHGASVRFFVTENCLRFVGREALEWASEQPVIVNPTGFAQHICHDDAVVVMPATADLMGKVAAGICPDGTTTLIQSALGNGTPVIFCPTMHGSLAASPFVQENRAKLANTNGVFFVPPRVEEGKEKAPPPDIVVTEAAHIINSHRHFKGQRPRILVTYGGTRVAIDSVRCLTNLSTGALGQEVVRYAYRMGLDVTAVETGVARPTEDLARLTLERHPEYGDLLSYLQQLHAETYQGIFHIAAVSDYLPARQESGKIAGDKESLTLNLVPSQKLLALRNLQPIPYRMACKLTGGSKSEGMETARNFAHREGLSALLWNHADVLKGGDHTGSLIVPHEGRLEEMALHGKQEIAKAIVSHFLHTVAQQ